MIVTPNRNCIVEGWRLMKGVQAEVPDEIGWALVERGYARQKWDPPAPIAAPKKKGK